MKRSLTGLDTGSMDVLAALRFTERVKLPYSTYSANTIEPVQMLHDCDKRGIGIVPRGAESLRGRWWFNTDVPNKRRYVHADLSSPIVQAVGIGIIRRWLKCDLSSFGIPQQMNVRGSVRPQYLHRGLIDNQLPVLANSEKRS